MEEKKSNSLPVIIIVLLVAAFLISRFVNKPGSIGTSTPTPTPTLSENSPSATPVDVINGEITLEAGSFYFKPALLRAKKGEKIKITLNSVSMMHDFNIDELGVKVPIAKSGSTSTVEFTPSKAGEFEFYCSVGSHRQQGQVGRIIVTE